jgi:catechol 2,3-dioxygenase
MSDHFVSEAIYLRDPDHHGIEIYADRPRAQWEGQVGRMGTVRLDTDSLLAELPDPATEPFAGLPAGTTVGHVHLRVTSIPETVAWYRDIVGFDLMVQFGGQAAFLAAGGYHHHFGTNTWESAGRGQAPAGTATLRHATVVLPSATDVEAAAARVAAAGQQPEPYAATGGLPGGTLVRDPSGNALLLVAAAAG